MMMFTYNYEKWKQKGGLHSTLGLILLIVMSLLTLGGIFSRRLLQTTRWSTTLALNIKLGHKLFGYLTLILAQVTVITGGLGHPLSKVLVILQAILIAIIIGALELRHRLASKKETPFRNVDRVIKREEFDEMIARGEKLVLLDSLVLDVQRFGEEHPGGQFLIDFNVGRDISKYFYGGYVLEYSAKMKPTTHSNVARAIVNGLIIGKLTETSQTFEGKIIHCHEINQSTKVIALECDKKDIVTDNVDDFGKHYLVRSLNNRNV